MSGVWGSRSRQSEFRWVGGRHVWNSRLLHLCDIELLMFAAGH